MPFIMRTNTSKDATHEDCRKVLEPFLEMLQDREKTLSTLDWTQLVNTTKQRIIEAPEQYLEVIPQSPEVLSNTIEKIFSERLN
jgi:hypothetical protein